MTQVSFPGLGIGPFEINGVAFKLFGLEVAWYGVLITVGMILAFVYCMRWAKYEGIKSDDMLDLAILVVILSITGARLYYVIFELEHFIATGGTFWQNFGQTFLNIINIRDGGLAIYGGVLGGFFSALIISKNRKIRFPILLDTLVGGVLIGQIVGRWGNFMNVEAYGYETKLPWRMGINRITAGGLHSSYMEVHPTFLYESLWNLVGFLLMTLFYKKKKFHGQHFAFYLIWYGAGRAVIEGFRTDSLWLFGEGSIRVSQAVGIITCFIGLVIAVVGILRVYKGIDIWGIFVSKLPKKRKH
ncbi:MAG: prolipoprotein diacylglyceryl transferase [Clostridia bacterium]|nr:prolipoprotein diacylglyceryl transferase [Clostridia bacterium]